MKGTTPALGLERPSTADYVRRVLAIVAVMVLHLVVYFTVTRVNSNRPPEVLQDPSIALDDRIPLLGWTWVFYWAAYPYLTLGAALVVASMREAEYKLAIKAFIVITLIGGAVQVLYPVAAPWTSETHAMQTRMHESAFTRPYASLPSMHVAYSVITGFMGAMVVRSAGLRWFHILLPVAIAVSTLTLKEHYVADAVAGMLLGVAGGAWWWWKSRGAAGRSAAALA